MKQLSRRSVATLILAAILIGGLAAFAVDYALNAERWVVFPGSPHVYNGTDLSKGTVTDRAGETLLRLGDGREYARSADLRRATVHLLGDRVGNIPSPALRRYAARLVGYSPVSGLYGSEGRLAAMELTISAGAQTAALRALAGRNGTVFVYNYRTGEILCAASSPSFDPDEADHKEVEGIYVNRPFGALYTPGSIFKIVTAAALLEQVPGSDETVWHCDGIYELGGDMVTCGTAHGDVTLKDALAKSCNCAFAQIAESLDLTELEREVFRWRVTTPCEFDGYTTPAGRFDLTDASAGDSAWACIGQHTDLVNPCSFARFLGAIAGEGRTAEPYLVRSVGSYHAKTTVTKEILDPGLASLLGDYLENNVKTVYGAEQFPDVTVCAKSGTAEVGEGQPPNANFAGFIRDERYPLAFYVTVENAGSGSAVCAPIAGEVLRVCVEELDRENGK